MESVQLALKADKKYENFIANKEPFAMRVAILGATSQIAKDLVESFAAQSS